MKRLEASVEGASCREILRTHGVTCLKLNLKGRRGYADRLALVPGGRPLFMEYKRAGGKLDPLQEHRKAELEKLGYDVVGPVSSVEEALEAVRAALARALS
jgi:hypothetical protein